MKEKEIFDSIVTIIQERQGEDFVVTESLSLKDDLDADSVDLMEFILTLEDDFNIEISDEEIDQLQSVGDVVEVVKSKPQLFTPNLKTIQNPCLSLDPGWFLFFIQWVFFTRQKRVSPLWYKCRKKHKKKGNSHEQFTKSSLPKQVFLPTIFRWRSFNPVWWSYLFSGTFFPVETKRADF